jgi:hypothetical protein
MEAVEDAGMSLLLMYTKPRVRAASRRAAAHSGVSLRVMRGIGEVSSAIVRDIGGKRRVIAWAGLVVESGVGDVAVPAGSRSLYQLTDAETANSTVTTHRYGI